MPPWFLLPCKNACYANNFLLLVTHITLILLSIQALPETYNNMHMSFQNLTYSPIYDHFKGQSSVQTNYSYLKKFRLILTSHSCEKW